jgi:polar amino acid transport system substrate-binding protein
MRDGRLEAIHRKWKIWNDDQRQLFRRRSQASPSRPLPAIDGQHTALSTEATRRYWPSLLRAATITLVLSCGAMLVAVALGVGLRPGALRGRLARMALTGYVELIRGTPLLPQLFVWYYASPHIRCRRFSPAARLALNYARPGREGA